MTNLDVAGLLLSLAMAAVAYWRLHTYRKAFATDQMHCRFIPVAGVGSVFAPRFEKFIELGTTIYMPAGDGLYHKQLTPKKNKLYLSQLESWLKLGATINVIISEESEEAILDWQSFKNAHPKHLNVYLLHREKVVGENAELIKKQIETLDTFHATILLSPKGSKFSPGAMWIEKNHPLHSKYAFDVECADPKVAATDDRIFRYQEIYKKLLTGPHVSTLEADAKSLAKAA